jgi:hypothetical protein
MIPGIAYCMDVRFYTMSHVYHYLVVESDGVQSVGDAQHSHSCKLAAYRLLRSAKISPSEVTRLLMNAYTKSMEKL